ncbi:MAG: hypothetical protein ACYSU4_09740, partial [Planctomycetota bacterium]
MFSRKSLVKYLTVFAIVSFSIDNFSFGNAANKSWKASPDLVEELTKRRSETNYSEQRVPKYTLPNPLKLSDGARVTDRRTWRTKRRPEILELFRKYVYGRAPIAR